jgi:hypothetical protein
LTRHKYSNNKALRQEKRKLPRALRPPGRLIENGELDEQKRGLADHNQPLNH